MTMGLRKTMASQHCTRCTAIWHCNCMPNIAALAVTATRTGRVVRMRMHAISSVVL